MTSAVHHAGHMWVLENFGMGIVRLERGRLILYLDFLMSLVNLRLYTPALQALVSLGFKWNSLI